MLSGIALVDKNNQPAFRQVVSTVDGVHTYTVTLKAGKHELTSECAPKTKVLFLTPSTKNLVVFRCD